MVTAVTPGVTNPKMTELEVPGGMVETETEVAVMEEMVEMKVVARW